MTSKEIEEKLKSIISKVAKLGWVQKFNNEPYMHLADVEKTIIALFDPTYMQTIDLWVNQAENRKEVPEELPTLKHLDYERASKQLEIQAKILGQMIRGEQCIFKEGCCPFKLKVATATENMPVLEKEE